MKIEVNGEVQNYAYRSGVVLDDKFLSFEEFKKAFKDMLLKSEAYTNLRYNMAQTQKIIHIMNTPIGRIGVAEYTEHIHEIITEFSKFMGGLGGNIGLLTTFSFGKQSQRTYYLANQEDLPSYQDVMGHQTYENTRQSLIRLSKQIENLELLDKTFKKHLMEFSNQLHNPTAYSKDNFISLRKWSYYNLPKRWKAYERGTMHSISYSDYFWGRGQSQGYIAEAYGTHLALIHPNALVGAHIKQLKSSVISEHGGFGSNGLFELLGATKGNTSSHLSGDIVVVDGNGIIQFNIQSKASKNTKYNINIAYQDFMKKMEVFLRIYEKYSDDIENIADEDVMILFNMFKTSAWVPIEEELLNNIDIVTDELLDIIAI